MAQGFGASKLQNSKLTRKDYFEFLLHLLNVTRKKNRRKRFILSLLEANLGKLNDVLIQVLPTWADTTFLKCTHEEAVSIAVAISNFSDVIREFNLGSRANNIEIAITGYEIVVQVLTRSAYPEQWAVNQNNMGIAYTGRICGNQTVNLEQAVICCENALQVYTVDAFPEEWAMSQNNLGIAYFKHSQRNRSENLEQAISCYKNALQVYTRQEFPKDWAMVQHNLGNAYRERIQEDRAENIEHAISCYKNALQVYTRKNFPQNWAITRSNLGNAYWKRILGDRSENVEQALTCQKETLKVYTREAYPEGWALTQHDLGVAYLQRIQGEEAENVEEAIACYERTLQVHTRKDFPHDWAMAQLSLGNAYSDRIQGQKPNNLEKAIAYYENALEIYSREDFPQEWAMTQNNLGDTYSDQGQISQAIACFRLALEVRTPTAFPIDCFQSACNLGNTAFTAGLWTEAIQGYTDAIEAVETSRSWVNSESRRQEILAEAIDVYKNMVQACINAGQLDKAIEYAERSRSKRLVDLMASNDLYQSGEIPPEVKELLQQYEALQDRIDQERCQNNSGNNRELMGVGTTTQSRASFQAYNEAIANLEAEKQQIWEQLRRLDPVLAGEIQVSAPDFVAMQELIDQPTTAILSFYTTSNDTHIFILRQNQITLHTCNGQGIETLQSWISLNWLFPYVADHNTWKNQINNFLSELAQRLQLPELISQHLEDIKELILVPHLFLHQIPFAALPVGDGQYLANNFLIRYTPSCQVLEFCQKRPHLGDSLTYGTVEDATEDLPCAGFEGEQIARLHNIPEGQRLKGKAQATVKNYRELAKNVQVIHSSHHAESRLDNPLESVLKLADGTITLGQLMTPSWRLPDLSDVFLSCCETGLGVTETTDDILTLSTGFLCAGARSVVSTLWAVDDLATALFSIFYYQHRQQGKNRPEALQQAQIQLRQLNKDDLAELAKKVDAERKQARSKRNQYQPNSAEYLECDREYKKYAGVTIQLQRVKNSPEECPFSNPRYWAAFTCSGLR